MYNFLTFRDDSAAVACGRILAVRRCSHSGSLFLCEE
jgi:hypothetical protein